MGNDSTLVMPKLGLTMTEGTITEWRVKPGESFTAGQIIAVVETEKIANEVEAPGQGVMSEHLASKGDTIAVGEPIAQWSLHHKATHSITSPVRAKNTRPTATPISDQKKLPQTKNSQVRVIATPLARRIAHESGIDLITLKGSGPGGRIKAGDVLLAQSEKDTQFSPLGKGVANPCFIIADANAGRLVALVDRLVNTPDVGVITHAHITYLAVAKALLQYPEANQISNTDARFTRGQSINIGIFKNGDTTLPAKVLQDVSSKTLKSLVAEADQINEMQSTINERDSSKASTAIAEVISQDIAYMSFPVPTGFSSILGIGTPKNVFKPDDHKQPLLLQEIGLSLSYDQSAISHSTATSFLGAIKSNLETPLRLLAG
ncbi:MAG TPA: hypothetical protein DGZ24_00205 [Rhodospirillaceae bacterium]|nr:hypothetical protein [Rhodospirillaceae bacterium]